jgi:nucleoside-diphosphate-sugar epimerase
MNITIIGGSGFIGSFLMQELSSNELINIDKNPSPFFQSKTKIIDIRNKKKLILNKNADFVVLLAAEHRDDISPSKLYYDVNVQGTKNVLESMDKAGIKNLIFTSSVAVYGLNKENPNESHDIDPFNHYGKSKWEAEKVIKQWYDNNPSNKYVTIIRPTVVFGERNRGNVYNLLKQISSGKFLLVGKGVNKKSMAYVRNVTSFIKFKIQSNSSGYNVYNFVDKPDLSMLELISIIEKRINISYPKFKIPYFIGVIGGYFFDCISIILRKKLPISSIRIKKFCATTQFDASKVHNEFEVPFSLSEGLNKTLDYEFSNHKEDDVLFYSE